MPLNIENVMSCFVLLIIESAESSFAAEKVLVYLPCDFEEEHPTAFLFQKHSWKPGLWTSSEGTSNLPEKHVSMEISHVGFEIWREHDLSPMRTQF